MHLLPPRADKARRQAPVGPHKCGRPFPQLVPGGSTSLQGEGQNPREVQTPVFRFPDSLFHGSQRPQSSCLFNRGKNEFLFIP